VSVRLGGTAKTNFGGSFPGPPGYTCPVICADGPPPPQSRGLCWKIYGAGILRCSANGDLRGTLQRYFSHCSSGSSCHCLASSRIASPKFFD